MKLDSIDLAAEVRVFAHVGYVDAEGRDMHRRVSGFIAEPKQGTVGFQLPEDIPLEAVRSVAYELAWA